VLEKFLDEYWPNILTLGSLALAIGCSGHAVLHKRDPRAATGWIGIIWLVPVLGGILYFLLGINRVRRFARTIMIESPFHAFQSQARVLSTELASRFPDHPAFVAFAALGAKVTTRALLKGNEVRPLVNGDEAYPVMLQAIEEAQASITLSTYIFDNDTVGKRFIEALSRAVDRGVEVRVLIDDIGLRYSWRPVLRSLRRARIPVAQFMGALRPMTFPHVNLRKHRKLLVIDGEIGFTGGMNIREGHQLSLNPVHPIQDLHFRIRGPVVTQLQESFTKDWAFTTKEMLSGGPWFREQKIQGESWCRVINDGPDDDFNKLSMVIEGAISSARDSVWIITPYFLPHYSLGGALTVAANKGVVVNIILPAKNNLSVVQWASNTFLLPLVRQGCRLWFSAPPFDHTKLIVVDERWVLLGSANLDPRSLRLNFELCVECFDEALGKSMMEIVRQKLADARLVPEAELRSRRLSARLRDGVARLLSPYL
jgi:cardiolipin synthase